MAATLTPIDVRGIPAIDCLDGFITESLITPPLDMRAGPRDTRDEVPFLLFNADCDTGPRVVRRLILSAICNFFSFRFFFFQRLQNFHRRYLSKYE